MKIVNKHLTLPLFFPCTLLCCEVPANREGKMTIDPHGHIPLKWYSRIFARFCHRARKCGKTELRSDEKTFELLLRRPIPIKSEIWSMSGKLTYQELR